MLKLILYIQQITYKLEHGVSQRKVAQNCSVYFILALSAKAVELRIKASIIIKFLFDKAGQRQFYLNTFDAIYVSAFYLRTHQLYSSIMVCHTVQNLPISLKLMLSI